MRQEESGIYQIETLGVIGDLVKNGSVDHVSCSFSIHDGKLRIERLTFESNNGPIDLTRVPSRAEFTPTQFQAVMACGS